jgi:hypothetical protein
MDSGSASKAFNRHASDGFYGSGSFNETRCTMLARLFQSTAANSLRAFHEDEDGMEALQVVMIVAAAAIVLLALKGLIDSVRQWAQETVDKMKQIR